MKMKDMMLRGTRLLETQAFKKLLDAFTNARRKEDLQIVQL
ncbi:MAG: hypothetical protein ACLU8S_03200 [Coprococcus phoceensis]